MRAFGRFSMPTSVISAALSAKSRLPRFSASRSRLEVRGIGMMSFCSRNRSATCAGDLPWARPMCCSVSSPGTLPRASDDFGLIEIGVGLDLQYHKRLGGKPVGLVEHGDVEIRHPDMFGTPRRLDLAKRRNRPGQRNLRIGPVDHQEIAPRQSELLQTFIDRALEIAGREPVEPDFCGDEDVFALDAGAPYA